MNYFILSCFLIVSIAQRGGGGGSYSFSSYSSTGYVGLRRGNYIVSCTNQCNIKHKLNTQLLKTCIQKCHSTNKYIIISAILIVFGGTGCIFLCTHICIDCQSSSTTKSPHDRYEFIEKTKSRLHKVSLQYMTADQFEIQRQIFIKEKWKLYYIQSGKQYNSQQLQIQMKYESPFLYSFVMNGIDDANSWTGKGYYYCTNNGIKLWMIKDYDNKVSMGQTGSYDILMFEGRQSHRDQYQGRWYYLDFEYDKDFAGTWEIVNTSYNILQRDNY